MASMKPLIFPLFLLIIFSLILEKPSANSSHDIVPETCKLCAKNDPNINYTFCVKILESEPKSRHCDRRGLAIIAAKLAKPEVKRAKTKAKSLLKAQPGNPYMRSCLEACQEIYSTCMEDLEAAVKSIKAGRYIDANIQLSAALDAPSGCEDGFLEGGMKSPLAAEDGDLFSRVLIALAITALLL